MADQALQSNGQSPLILSFDNSSTADVSYHIPEAIPSFVPEISVVTPANNHITHNQELSGKMISFNITKTDGRWAQALLELFFNVKASFSGASGNPSIGLEMIQDLILKCASREIWRQSDQSASSRTQISNVETAAAIYKNSKFLSTAVGTYGQPVSGAAAIATGIDFLTYVPVFVPFFEVINNYLSLYNTEPLVLEVHFNTNERMGLPDTQALQLTALETGTTVERPRFSYTYTTQIVSVVAAQVLVKDGFYAYKCNINTDVSASDTFISIRKVGGLVTTGADIGNFTPIAKHSLRFNNRPFYENLPATVTSYLSDIKSRGGLALSRTNVLGTSLSASATDKKHLHLPWCDEPWERTRNSGTLAFKALGGPELTLFTGTNIGDAAYTYEIVIVHQAQTMLTQLGKNGVVEQGISR
ncbi:hypothetical protein BASA81_008126 [Batrachochytrium salamandrivorans]|nr:hypothetical protein BASA81_008126 [Batrachochytrium salamandrivorans]